ncbi:Noscapine synthase SDR1 [Sesamum angolense]|uniref:Noscapine synthase SDR1 n=1 Tax=Sesamum angolense TaxID=2727404 RepID=A0AAE1WPI3_9LAMI|nr:Noscapine synthase SDR1 [Sesamum angolense]
MEEEREQKQKGRICVSGGTGYLGSWTVKRMATLSTPPSGWIQIFDADLDRPDSFAPAIGGCVGVFHVAHPLDFDEKEAEEVKVKRTTSGTLGILQACLDSTTVRRVVYTSTVSTILLNDKAVGSDSTVDEDSWTDVDFVRRLESFRGAYVVTKTLTERIAMEFEFEN